MARDRLWGNETRSAAWADLRQEQGGTGKVVIDLQVRAGTARVVTGLYGTDVDERQ
jgi:hypothetical protein